MASMKDLSYTLKDRKKNITVPLTNEFLFNLLGKLLAEDPSAKKKPVCLLTDEECNDVLHLYEIEITDNGSLLLRPAGTTANTF